MSTHLAIYLNDHLAGATAGLDLVAHLADAPDPRVSVAATGLTADLTADRRELKALMQRLGVEVSAPRQATGWISEKLLDLKLRFEDRAGGAFRAFELLEALSLGIEGKRALWNALQAAAEHQPLLTGVDYPALAARAGEQRRVVEDLRLKCAPVALGPVSP